MSTQIDLGPVLPILKGDWDATITYERLNIVRHNSASWICNVATSIGVEPTEDSTDWYLQVKDISSVTSVNGMKGDVVIELTETETPSVEDNSTRIATTEWVIAKNIALEANLQSYVQTAVDDAEESITQTTNNNINAVIDNYLPLTGGTMSDGIIFTVKNGLNILSADNNDTYLQINGGTSYDDGVSAQFYGQKDPNYPGALRIHCIAGTDVSNFILGPTGFSWNGERVIRSVDGIYANKAGELSTATELGSNYIRFSNGLQLCWDTISVAEGSSAKTWTFPKAFSSAPRCAATIIGTGDLGAARHYSWYGNSASSIKIKVDSLYGTGWHVIAIGRWK